MPYVRFVDELPPEGRGRRPAGEHAKIAATLRGRPDEWALIMRKVHASTARAINSGTLAAYRPAGAYEARTRANGYRGGRVDVYARYVGAPEPEPRATSRRRRS